MCKIWFLCLYLRLIVVYVQSYVNLLWPAANNQEDSKALYVVCPSGKS